MKRIPQPSKRRRRSPSLTWARAGIRALGCLAFVSLGGACTGVIDGPAGGDAPQGGLGAGAGPAAGGADPKAPGGQIAAIGAGSVPLRRLNFAEYQATIQDWLGISVDISDFPVEGMSNTGFDTLSAVLAISQLHVEALERAATAVIDTLFTQDPGGVRVKWCSYASGDQSKDEACVAQIVATFAEQAWRRPHASWAGNDGLPTYQSGLTAKGRFGAHPLEVRLKQVLKSILLGPRFLLRVELSDAEGRLDAPSMASRLSYMLWSSAPDAPGLNRNLLGADALRAELARLQFSGSGYQAKYQRFLERFPDQWLELGHVPLLRRNPDQFPKFTPAVQKAIRLETGTFLRGFIGVQGAQTPPLRGLLSLDSPSADPALQELYAGSPRSGLLTQASILAVTSLDTRTSAVRRGKWVMERLLCEAPPPPPAALSEVISNKVEAADQSAPERERLAAHRSDPQCNACHQTMDIIGIGLEEYDAIGAYRSLDKAGRDIDPSGILPGTTQPFGSALELASVLALDPRVPRCMAQQLLTYGTGREYTEADAALLDSIVATAGGAEATFQSTLEAVILSPAFRAREGSMQ